MNNWKQNFLEYYFSDLNDEQKQAVFTVKGPVLVLSGAGSGKTTVIVNRIANMILFGDAYNSECENQSEYEKELISDFMNGGDTDISEISKAIGVDRIKPWNILSITFTNKAAGEMKERLNGILGEETASNINASTFHSACAKILRFEAEKLGYTSQFTIYDSDDTKRLIKTCMQTLGISQQEIKINPIISTISLAKNRLVSPDNFENYMIENGIYPFDEYRKRALISIYKLYEQRLHELNAFDFDDLLSKTVELFQKNPDVLEKYQNRYKYILVDEYQDTNNAQYALISLLSGKSGNLCVVGDDDQSIYGFRGATIDNILSFENQFPGCKTIKLETNYRSTKIILDAANSIIKNNVSRKSKSLKTDRKGGDKIIWYEAENEEKEAEFIKNTIKEGVKNGDKYSDYAILYRMNALSGNVETALFNSIPYKIYGGTRFYDRREIRDMIAYMSVTVNEWDSVRLRRIINVPKRGIGDSTVNLLENISRDLNISIPEIIKDADSYGALSRKSIALLKFSKILESLKQKLNEVSLPEFIDVILKETGYLEELKKLDAEGEERLQNIYELKSALAKYEEESDEPSLEDFLEGISLYTDVDSYEDNGDVVSLMTIHSSKGLEFKNVFIIALENGIFPSYSNLNDKASLEEERRLAYVAVTRAKNRLYFTTAESRLLFGKRNSNPPSVFIEETDQSLIEKKTPRPKKSIAIKKMNFASSGIKTSGSQNIDISKLDTGVRVRHPKFGDGTILTCKEMGGDKLLEISFDEIGTKKIMAKYARLEII